MGALFDYIVFGGDDKDLIEQRFIVAQEESGYDSGHSYSGEIGVMSPYGVSQWHDLGLGGQDEAEEWLSNNHQKWEPAEAVSFIEKGRKMWLVGGWCSS